jgi:glutathione S-transferase
MILYTDSQYASPYAMSAFVALTAKGVAFTTEPMDMSSGALASPAYAGLSLTSRVPTLVDGDFALAESSAIAEYLEEKIPWPRLYPEDVQSRARARQLQAWLRSDLMALRSERTTEVVFFRPTSTPLSTAGQADVRKLLHVAGTLLSHGQHNLFGDWSIADLDLAIMLNRLVRNGDPAPARLVEYANGQWQLPAVREWLDLTRP